VKVLRFGRRGVEDLPEVVLDGLLVGLADLGQDVPGFVDDAPLAQGPAQDQFAGGDDARGTVGHHRQRGTQAALEQAGQEVLPGVGALRGGGGQADETRACRRW
jgi:hypothetical protein